MWMKQQFLAIYNGFKKQQNVNNIKSDNQRPIFTNVERGNFKYDTDGKIVWEPDANGSWQMAQYPDKTV